ncbi:MAG TPA: hypothetical protein HPP77_00610 [Candidatus Hydrogenedentes bacterium]|nr:hypothetical protein [Candidatus Hydrogenedentota bacterium]HIJ72965.1 hypothetical protein [Candidatus Hydrogenedentota bacterium]
MISDKIVCLRVKRGFYEEKPWAYVGKVRQFSENWVAIDARGIYVFRTQTMSIEVDQEVRGFVIPRESIASIRVLPDDFDRKSIQVDLADSKLRMLVKGAPDCFIGDVAAGGA